MNISLPISKRYTAKTFDPQRPLAADQVAQIETLLRLSPSSTNIQPWHFFITDNAAGKARIAKATSGVCAFNEPKVRNASHVVVLCARTSIDESYLHELLAHEERDGRFTSNEYRDTWHRVRSYFVNTHRFELRDVQHWNDKQVYVALGTLLMGAAAMGIDACPIEGFHQAILDEELGLREKGLVSSVIVALGYAAVDDSDARLPKSRWRAEQVFTRI
ncbi:MAG: oxygen-insensitive NAD(P)H nitroreductase [Pseudomonas sp.]